MEIRNLPPDAALQALAAAAKDPEGSGNTYQLRVTGPFPEEPQPALISATAVVSTAAMCDLRTVTSPPIARAPPDRQLPTSSELLNQSGDSALAAGAYHGSAQTSAAVRTISSSFATSWS
jgi:hypothetical protein